MVGVDVAVAVAVGVFTLVRDGPAVGVVVTVMVPSERPPRSR